MSLLGDDSLSCCDQRVSADVFRHLFWRDVCGFPVCVCVCLCFNGAISCHDEDDECLLQFDSDQCLYWWFDRMKKQTCWVKSDYTRQTSVCVCVCVCVRARARACTCIILSWNIDETQVISMYWWTFVDDIMSSYWRRCFWGKYDLTQIVCYWSMTDCFTYKLYL